MHSNNGLYIKTWEDEIYDLQLIGFMNVLLSIYEYSIEDVRLIVKLLHSEISEKLIEKSMNPYALFSINEMIV